MKKAGKIIIPIVVILLIAGGAWLFMKNRGGTELTTGAISARLEDASDCTTQKLIYQGAVNSKKGKIPILTKSSFLMTYEASVRAGFDISEADIKLDDDKVEVNIPATDIQEITIDPNSLEFYDTSMTILKPDGKEETKKALKAAQDDAKKQAAKSGLLEAADENAKTLIKGLLTDSVGDREIIVNVEK